MPTYTIPEQMQVLQLTAYDPTFSSLQLAKWSVPRPGPDHVLVRMAYAPINPSDLMFMAGTYIVHKKLPVIPGTVGSGTVVAAGEGLRARFLLGRHVSCAAPYDGNGTWAEYMVVPISSCIPLFNGVDLEQGANMLSNSLTAVGLFESLHRRRHRCFIQNAAAGDIPRMLFALAAQKGMQVINVVRRPQQVALLHSLGSQYVLDSSSSNYEAELRQVCEKLKPTALIDSVAGSQTRLLSEVVVSGGEIILCGKLSGDEAQFSQNALYNRQLTIRAFSVMNWVRSKSLFSTLKMVYQLERFVKNYQGMGAVRKVGLAQVPGHVSEVAQNATVGKTFIQFANRPIDG